LDMDWKEMNEFHFDDKFSFYFDLLGGKTKKKKKQANIILINSCIESGISKLSSRHEPKID
jgi:hypothetical protein